MVPCLVIMTDL